MTNSSYSYPHFLCRGLLPWLGMRQLLLLLLALFCHSSYAVQVNRSFTIDYKNDQFLKDGKPFRYVSAGIHYFRVLETSWEDRLSKIRKSGANAIQTYIPWNYHEPEPGKYDFDGSRDLVHFIKLAQQHDLLVILRPGPYICAEWEFGGFPYWLLKQKEMVLRSSKDERYITAVHKWLSVLLPIIKPLLYANGGPVIMVQVENEYGSYGADHTYMEILRKMFLEMLGEDVILFTTDGAGDGFLKGGALEDLYTTVDFGAGGDPANAFKIQRKYQPHGPFINSEYYTGWLDHWGDPHARVSAKTVATWLDKILSLNASVNMYMFEGGTNFGFMNGANQGSKYQPQPTSYDYDAPLTEAGDPTMKYFLIQQVISKYLEIPKGPQPKASPKSAYGKVLVNYIYTLDQLISSHYPLSYPGSFEDINTAYGYVLYRTILNCKTNASVDLVIKKLRDRATVIVDGLYQGILDRNHNNTISIKCGKVLDILVENQGRVNYGGALMDGRKGIIGNVTCNGTVLLNWNLSPVPLDDPKLLSNIEERVILDMHPSQFPDSMNVGLAVFHFSLKDIEDTFLKLDHWVKGVVILNGFNLGRYWNTMGPQKTLYVPKDVLRARNTLLVFETDQFPKLSDSWIEFIDHPIIG